MNLQYHTYLLLSSIIFLIWFIRRVDTTTFPTTKTIIDHDDIPIQPLEQEESQTLWHYLTHYDKVTSSHLDCLSPIVRDSLEKNRDLWDSKGVVSYTYLIQEDDCTNSKLFCDTEHTIQVVNENVYAVDGVPVNEWTAATINTQTQQSLSSRVPNNGNYPTPTIPDLFTKIEESIDRCFYKIGIEYDAAYGYPTSLHIEPYYHVVDASLDDDDGKSFKATVHLLSIEETDTEKIKNSAARRGRSTSILDIATVELFPTIVAFVLLTTIFL
jgi:hypothetical protein